MGLKLVASRSSGKPPGAHYEKRLTAAFVKTAPPGRHTDGGGLYLEVDPSGARRWLLRLVIEGRRRDLGFGAATLVSLAEARAKAQEFRRIARAGGDPTSALGRSPRSITFRTLAAEVHATHIKTTSRNGKHVDQWLNTLEAYAFPHIGNEGVDDVSRADVVSILLPIWQAKPETARRVLQRLKTVFDWAIVKGHRLGENPADGSIRLALPRQKKEVQHFAAIPWEETSDLMARLKVTPGIGAKALRFTILNDGGHLIVSPDDATNIAQSDPIAHRMLRRLTGASDVINGKLRYCLWLEGASPDELSRSPFVRDRVAKVRQYREASTRAATKRLADFPTQFGEIRHQTGPFVLIPRHSSERRGYVPMALFEQGEIAHDSCLFVAKADKITFGLLTSAMHMAWLRHIGGRVKSDYRYSIGLVYNTFPMPLNAVKLGAIAPLVDAILAARAAHPGSSLADLYDPDLMPPNLRRAHQALDRAVDRLYAPKGFASDRARAEHLLGLYEQMMAPLTATPKPARRRRAKV